MPGVRGPSAGLFFEIHDGWYAHVCGSRVLGSENGRILLAVHCVRVAAGQAKESLPGGFE